MSLASLFVGYLGQEFILYDRTSPLIPNSVQLVPFLLSLFGVVLVFVVYELYLVEMVWVSNDSVLYDYFNTGGQFNYVFHHFMVFNLIYLGHYVCYRNLDRGLFEMMGPKGFSRLLIFYTKKSSN